MIISSGAVSSFPPHAANIRAVNKATIPIINFFLNMFHNHHLSTLIALWLYKYCHLQKWKFLILLFSLFVQSLPEFSHSAVTIDQEIHFLMMSFFRQQLHYLLYPEYIPQILLQLILPDNLLNCE